MTQKRHSKLNRVASISIAQTKGGGPGPRWEESNLIGWLPDLLRIFSTEASGIFCVLIRSLALRVAYWLKQIVGGVPETATISWGVEVTMRWSSPLHNRDSVYAAAPVQAHLRKHHRAPPDSEARAGGVWLTWLAKEKPSIWGISDFLATSWYTTLKNGDKTMFWGHRAQMLLGTHRPLYRMKYNINWSKRKWVTDSPRYGMIWQTSNPEELSRPICQCSTSLY